MGRDLLYKPPVPIVTTEDEPTAKPGTKTGAKPRGRELGNVGKTFEKPAGAPERPAGHAPVYRSAYFNQDTSTVRNVNLRQSTAQALRGAEGAVDLKKVVLPPPVGTDSPDPAQLRGATDLMGVDGSFELSLESLLGRQSAWAKGKGVTLEAIKARLAQLEQMVEDRKRALARLVKGVRQRPAMSVTLDRAVSGEDALAAADDVVAAGRELVTNTAGQAEGMHLRIAKVLGIRRPAK